MAGNDGWMTVGEIATAVGATEYSVNRAVAALGLLEKSKKDIADRRRTIYPPGTLDQVRNWLETH
jgi:predicted transcriptional regulator